MTAAVLEPIGSLDPTSLGALHEVIDSLQGVGPTSLSGYDVLVTELDRAIRRLDAIRLRVIAAADAARVADRVGLTDTSSWLARRTMTGAAQAAADLRLATALAPANDFASTTRPCAEA